MALFVGVHVSLPGTDQLVNPIMGLSLTYLDPVPTDTTLISFSQTYPGIHHTFTITSRFGGTVSSSYKHFGFFYTP